MEIFLEFKQFYKDQQVITDYYKKSQLLHHFRALRFIKFYHKNAFPH